MTETLRILLFVAVIVYFAIVVHLLKIRWLDLKYTLLWLGLGVVMMIFVAFPELLDVVRDLMGIANKMYALFTIALAAVTIIIMSLTSIVSKQKDAIKELVQQIGMMEKRIKELEKKTEHNND